jgi:hypothetical protein
MDHPLSPDKSSDQRPIDPHRPMTFQELCQYLRVRPPTIRTYMAERLREVGFKVGKEWRFLPLEVIEWLKWRQRRRAAGQSQSGHPAHSPSHSANPHIERIVNQHWPR